MRTLAAMPSRRSAERLRAMASIRRSRNVFGLTGGASTGAQFEAGRRRFWACAMPSSFNAAAYRAMPLEAQAAEPCTPSTDRDALLGLPGPIGRVGEQERLEAVVAVGMRLLSGLHSRDESVELVAIGGLIALQEKVERLVAGEAVGASEFDRRLTDVCGMNHALHAMPLRPLIVAISGAPRIRDLRHFARRGLHDDNRGVDVADVPDRLVDKRRSHRADRHRLLAKDKARKIEVMDHHVAEQAAGPGDVGDRGRPGIARSDRDDFERADRALGDAFAERGEIWIEAAIEADHQRRAGLLDDFEAGADALCL